ALAVEKAPLEDPLEPWRSLASSGAADGTLFTEQWRKLADKYATEDRQRTEFNQKELVTFADFRRGDNQGWQVGGQGLRSGPGRSGDFMLQPDGSSLVK